MIIDLFLTLSSILPLFSLFLSIHSFPLLLSLPSLYISFIRLTSSANPCQLLSWYWLSSHIFIRILLFMLLDAAPGQWSSGALERSTLRLHVNSYHVSLSADLLLLICSFQPAVSVLQGCFYLTLHPGAYCHEDASQANWGWRLSLGFCVSVC